MAVEMAGETPGWSVLGFNLCLCCEKSQTARRHGKAVFKPCNFCAQNPSLLPSLNKIIAHTTVCY